ncbi:MAG: restriction endonuclease subunit S [Treponema sp.]|nr:restriction endonuclease subunit S [Treponema sp.]
MTAKDLKNALLQEAVQGKLVPQIASEGNAKDLLEEIRKEKTKLVKEGKLKKEKPLPEITEEEIPFDIPENWCWCRITDIATCELGKTKDAIKNKGELKNYLCSINIQENGIDLSKVKQMKFENDEIERYSVKKNDLLICEGGDAGRCAIYDLDTPMFYQNALHRVRFYNDINPIFYLYLLQLYKANNILMDASKGVTIQHLTGESLRNLCFPLPPLAEQKRIVAAIEKFMPLIEEYGKKETELKAFNEQIGTLTKKAILQEAVQGKLVPQISTEGNAKDLLEEINKEKAKVAGKASSTSFASKTRTKELSPITEDEIPFDIPESWSWCRVGDLFTTMSGLGYKKDVLSEKSSKMIRVLRGGNILDTSYIFKDDDIMISDKYVKSELFLKKNYLITPAVTSLEHIGKIGYVEKDYDDTVVGGFVLMLLPHYSDEVLSKYCLYLFATRWFRDMCKEITHKSGQAFYNLSRDKLLNLVIPVAPLAEQKRIVAAIEKMLPLCERLGE